MLVHVKLFATLARFSGGVPAGTFFDVEIPEGSVLENLVNQLGIPPEETRIAFVNGVIQSMDWTLKTGDEIGIFPPIGGG